MLESFCFATKQNNGKIAKLLTKFYFMGVIRPLGVGGLITLLHPSSGISIHQYHCFYLNAFFFKLDENTNLTALFARNMNGRSHQQQQQTSTSVRVPEPTSAELTQEIAVLASDLTIMRTVADQSEDTMYEQELVLEFVGTPPNDDVPVWREDSMPGMMFHVFKVNSVF